LNESQEGNSDVRVVEPRLLRVAVNNEILYKADLKTDRRAARSLTYNYTIKELTPEQLADEIRKRHNITSICLDAEGRFHRAKKYFKESHILGIDHDNDGSEYLSFEDALAHPFVAQYALLAYTTASHKPDFHKFRTLYGLEQPITDREYCEKIIRALIWLFGSDENCKDCSRFFFGAGEGGQVLLLGNTLTNSAIDQLLDEYALANEASELLPHEPTKEQTWESYNFDGTSIENRRRIYAQQAIDIAVGLIERSVPPCGDMKGNRHKSRLRAAYLLGGYIASSLLTYEQARAALEEAVARNTNNFGAAMQTVEKGLGAGQGKPITFEQKERDRQKYFEQKDRARATGLRQISEEEKRRGAEWFRNQVKKSKDADAEPAQEEMAAVDILNFILSGVKCPPERRGFALAVIGMLRERAKTGHEHEEFHANRIDLGKRLRGGEADSCSPRTLKATAQRQEEEWDRWQSTSGFVLIVPQTGGLQWIGGRNVKVESVYRVPLFKAWRDALALARLDPRYRQGSRARTKALRKAAQQVIPQMAGADFKKDIDGVKRPQKGLVAQERRAKTMVINSIKRRLDGATLRATQHVTRRGDAEVAAKNLMLEVIDYTEEVAGGLNQLLIEAAEKASNLANQQIVPPMYTLNRETGKTDEQPLKSSQPEKEVAKSKPATNANDANSYERSDEKSGSESQNEPNQSNERVYAENESGASVFDKSNISAEESEEMLDEMTASILSY
jgi:hypothetical protein